MAGNTVSTAPSQLRQGAVERGRGWPVLEKISPNPAAGNYTYVIDGTYWRRLLTVSFLFTASATAGARSVSFGFLDGDGYVINSTLIAASVQANQVVQGYGDLQSTSPAEAVSSATGTGSVTSPAAFTTIAATTTVQPGLYSVSGSVNLAGTLTQGTDNNNVRISPAGGTAILIPNEIAPGPQPFGPYAVEVTTAGAITLQTGSNIATTGAIYAGTITAAPQPYYGAFTVPDLVMKSAWQYQVAIGNAQAGDALTNIAFMFERYPSSDVYLRDRFDPAEILAAAAVLLGG